MYSKQIKYSSVDDGTEKRKLALTMTSKHFGAYRFILLTHVCFIRPYKRIVCKCTFKIIREHMCIEIEFGKCYYVDIKTKIMTSPVRILDVNSTV